MIRYLKLRMVGSFLTLIYMIMVVTSIGKGFRDAIIVIAIILFFVSGIVEMKDKKAK